jgi:hypothetical protein
VTACLVEFLEASRFEERRLRQRIVSLLRQLRGLVVTGSENSPRAIAESNWSAGEVRHVKQDSGRAPAPEDRTRSTAEDCCWIRPATLS